MPLVFGGIGLLALGVIAALVLVKPADRKAPPRLDRKARLATAAAFVFILGTFSWRTRSASELNEAPVDAAAFVRLAADGLALALAVQSFWAGSESQGRGRWWLAWLYGGYITAALFGVLFAVQPQIVLFRIFDLAVCLTVAVALCAACTLAQVLTFWRRVLLFMTALILGSAVLSPSLAFRSVRGGLVPFRLEGVFPTMSANTVGFVGTMLVVLALASRGVQKWTLLLGLTLVLLSQYRTGYVAVAVVLVLCVAIRGDALSRLTLFLAGPPLAYLLVQSAAVEDAWVRGEQASRSAQTLSGRTVFWDVALQVAERSPIFGTGLTSGTRNEVLAARLGMEQTSTIHGTWIEAYVGTGLVGTAALALFVLVAARRSWQVRHLSAAPILMVAAMGVRSLTGTSIELASVPALLFLTFALAAALAGWPGAGSKASVGLPAFPQRATGSAVGAVREPQMLRV